MIRAGKQLADPDRRFRGIKRVLVAALLVALTLAAPVGARRSALAREWQQCSQQNVTPCIVYAATMYHQDVGEMEFVAWRESRDDWWARNGVCVGLFQINYPSTWTDTVPDGGSPYKARSPWSARYSALTAAWMWDHGEAGEWTTYP